MTYQIKELSSTKKELTLVIDNKEFLVERDKKIFELQKDVQLKGFRKGKAPITLIKRLFEKSVDKDVSQDMILKKFETIRKEEKISIIGQGKIKNLTISPEKNIEASIEFETLPTLNLPPLENYTINKLVCSITDSDIDKELDIISHQEGTWKSVERPVEEKDLIVADVQHIDENNVPIIGSVKKGQEYILDKQLISENFINTVVGTSIHETCVVIQKKDNDGLSKKENVSLEIKEIKELQSQSINDNFVKEYTENRLQTVGEFKASIRASLEKKTSQISDNHTKESIIDTLLKDNEFEVPDSLLKSKKDIEKMYAKTTLSQYRISPEKIDDEKLEGIINTKATRTAKWSIVAHQIASDLGITLTEEDFSDFFKHRAKQEGSKQEDVEAFYTSSESMSYLLNESLLSEKILKELVTSKITINEQSVSLQKLNELVKTKEPLISSLIK